MLAFSLLTVLDGFSSSLFAKVAYGIAQVCQLAATFLVYLISPLVRLRIHLWCAGVSAQLRQRAGCLIHLLLNPFGALCFRW